MTRNPPVSHEAFDEMHRLVAASLCGDLLPEQGLRFSELVRQDKAAFDLYLNLVFESSILLTWAGHGVPKAAGAASPSGRVSQAAEPALPTAALVGGERGYDVGRPVSYSSIPSTLFHTTFTWFSSGWPMAYLIATVILGVGLLIGAITDVSSSLQVANQSPLSSDQRLASVPAIRAVGRVTGMVNCQFSDEATMPFSGTYVSFGRRYALSSGLLEITYNTGAKVILEGPAIYEVDSCDGGFLTVGRLTARLEKKGVEARDQGREQGAASESNSQSQAALLSSSPASTFTVRTPTATVTDLGTEFGVSVAKDHLTDVCVFEGAVEVAQSNARNAEREINRRLTAGESVRIDSTVGIRSLAANTFQVSFVRKLPLRRPSTSGLGQGLVAYWSFDDAASLGKNAIGGGNLSPVNSPESEPRGLIGGALRLHGKDTLAYDAGHGVPAGVPVGDCSYSISAWLSISTRGAGGYGILGWGEPSLNQANALVIKPSEAGFIIDNYWWNYDLHQNVEERQILGGWRHLVATYDKRTRLHRIFLDGKWLCSRGVSKERELGANNFAIGRGYLDPNNPGEFFDGCLDEIGIWDRELSEAEIERLYNQGEGFNPLTSKPKQE